MQTLIQTSEVRTIIAQFAKTNKIGKAKIESFLVDVFSHLPKRKTGGHKPVSAESMKLREALRKLPSGKTFTSVEIAEKMGSNIAYVNNNLRFLQKTENKFFVAGVQKIAGKKGKPALIWQAN